MYLILLYIIILFVLFISCNNLIEGQEMDNKDMSDEDLEDLYRQAYRNEYTGEDIRKEQIEIEIKDKEIVLQAYLIDTVGELKNILSKNYNINIPVERIELIYDTLVLRDDYMLLQYGIKSGDEIYLDDSSNIMNRFTRSDSRLFRRLYSGDKRRDIDPYERYLEEFLKYNKVKRKKSDRIYSQRISNLFKNKSKPYLKAYNKYQYLDDNLNIKLKEKDDLIGENPNIDDPDLYDRIIQENVNDNIDNYNTKNENMDNEKKEVCCNKSGLDINNPILIKDDISNIIMPNELLYEQNTSIFGDFEPYNKNYYEKMKMGDKIYNMFNGSMRLFNNQGRLSV